MGRKPEIRIRPILRDASRQAVSEENQRYAQRTAYGDKRTTLRSMGRENLALGHHLNGQKATENFIELKIDSKDIGNTIGYSLQRLHDGVLNPEGFATLPEHFIHGVESLGFFGKLFFEDVEGLNLGVDIGLLAAKLASADSIRAKVSAALDIPADELIPGYALLFPSGNNEVARDRVDERADVGTIKTIRGVLLSQEPALQKETATLATNFVAAMEAPHEYHAFVHQVLSQTQQVVRPFAEAHKAAQAAGEASNVDLHALAHQMLITLGVDTSRVSPKDLVAMGDKLHAFATTELQKPKPMLAYTEEIVALSEEAATQRRQEASLKSRRNSGERNELLLNAVRWEHAGRVGRELLDTYRLAKQRIAA